MLDDCTTCNHDYNSSNTAYRTSPGANPFRSATRGSMPPRRPQQAAAAADVAPSPGSTLGSAKKRRLSAAKADDCLTVLTDNQATQDVETEIERLAEVFRKHPSVIVTVRAVVRMRLDGAVAKTIARGVRCLVDVPAYLARESLVALSGLNLGIFANIDDKDNNVLFLWGMGGDERYKLPKLSMPHDEYMAWVGEHGRVAGDVARRSASVIEQSGVDLDCCLGAASFVLPKPRDEMEDDYVVEELIDNATKRKAALPAAFRPRVLDITTTWTIESNYSMAKATLMNLQNRMNIPISALFSAWPLTPRLRTHGTVPWMP